MTEKFLNFKNIKNDTMKDLSNYRKSYDKKELLTAAIPDDAMQLFAQWFQEVDAVTHDEANAMTVATVGEDGFPKARIVLLKQFSDQGFVFYTNYNSEKGKAMLAHPQVCLSFFWHDFERQVIIKGIAQKDSEAVSDNYFQSRPHGSQLGAVVSNQSEVIPSREILEEKLLALEKEFENKAVPRPINWGGFLVKPLEIEFWQGRPNRLHDRIRYRLKENASWEIERLAP
jgi:pyridoxamine 5'-phosphate oxidase